MWSCSAERRRSDAAAAAEEGQARPAGLAAAPSGKGDRFFSNLMPSFVRR